MREGLEQRYRLKFCQKLSESQVETIRVYGYDPETKSQLSQWISIPRHQDQRRHSNVKVMLNASFDSRSVVHHKYAPLGQSPKSTRDVLCHLCDAVWHKTP